MKKQIFFLHFAGGSAYSYDFLKQHLPAYDIQQMELPGRGKRAAQPLVDSMKAAVDDYRQQLLKRMNGQPFIIYGHSMGAVIGAYLTSELEELNHFPERLIVSGNPGPGCFEYRKRYLLPQDEFLQELKNMGGMPADFFAHEGLINYFIPILKSDFKVLEGEPDRKFPPLKTPILAMMGDEEEKVDLIENWKKHTVSDCQIHVMKGKHFFIQDHATRISQLIEQSFK